LSKGLGEANTGTKAGEEEVVQARGSVPRKGMRSLPDTVHTPPRCATAAPGVKACRDSITLTNY